MSPVTQGQYPLELDHLCEKHTQIPSQAQAVGTGHKHNCFLANVSQDWDILTALSCLWAMQVHFHVWPISSSKADLRVKYGRQA